MLAARAEPIVAVATAAGRGAVGIVRLSGRGLAALLPALLRRVPEPRQALYGPFLANDGQALDHGLALWFPAPQSYTGEDVLELHAHGGPVLLQLLLARCLEAAANTSGLERLRLAQPGEFTERAFLNGKLDLAQAEAVADLIDASTEAAARSAGRALSGEFSRLIQGLSERLVKLRTLVEATLDFPEEEIDFLQAADAQGQLQRLRAQLAEVQRSARQGALLREGLTVVLAGQPNVGKSSLLNALAGAELAIVTPIPGTTRDRIEQSIQIEGVPLHIIDTAGLRSAEEASDEIERIGIGRSWQAIQDADVLLFLHDLSRSADVAHAQADADLLARLPSGLPVLHVHNKVDAVAPAQAQKPPAGQDQTLRLSARTGQGLEELRRALLAQAGWQPGGEGTFSARARHVQALRLAAAHLNEAMAHLARPAPALELLAEELRLAHEALSAIVGKMSADELLGEIFGRFCIGK